MDDLRQMKDEVGRSTFAYIPVDQCRELRGSIASGASHADRYGDFVKQGRERRMRRKRRGNVQMSDHVLLIRKKKSPI